MTAMRRKDRSARLRLFRRLAIGFGLIGAIGISVLFGFIGRFGLQTAALGGQADAMREGGTAGQDSTETPFNPHGNLVFRVTGATSCRDCHAAGRSTSGVWPVLDNERVRALVAKGKGAHAGRFADCFRCHPGGRLPSEQP
jgi:hypothetical protein